MDLSWYANVTRRYGFKYWEIGNENYNTYMGGETDSNTYPHDAYTYAVRTKDYLQQMKSADPSIKVGVVVVPGESNSDNGYRSHPAFNPRTRQTNYGWTPVLLTTLRSLGVTPDFITYHHYPGSMGNLTDSYLLQSSVEWITVAADLRQQISDYFGPGGTNIEIVCTENNSNSGSTRQSTSLVNGLYLADSMGQIMKTEFNALVWWDLRNNRVPDVNSDLLPYGWRAYGDFGMLWGEQNDIQVNRYPTFYAAKLMQYFARPGDTVLNVSSDHQLLAGYAVWRDDGSVTLLVINKDVNTTSSAQIALGGFKPTASATIRSYGIPQDEAARTGSGSQDITVRNFVSVSSNFTYVFPPLSLTLFTLVGDVLPAITVQPKSQRVLPGKPMTLSVGATGTPPLVYQWQFNGINLVGATGSSLTLSIAKTTDAGSYTVVVSNASGSVISAAAALSVGKPIQTISFHPLSAQQFPGPSFTLNATASSGLPVNFSLVSGPATISGSLITLIGAGTVEVRASQPGNDVYDPAVSVDQSFTVTPLIVLNRFDNSKETGQWRFDFGGAGHAAAFDSTVDANGNPSSGSLKITIDFNAALGDQNKAAFTRDILPTVSGSTLTGIQMDVLVDSSSAHDPSGTSANASIVIRDANYNIQGSQDIRSSSGWIHIETPLSGVVNQVRGLTWQAWGAASLNITGRITVWIDNVVLAQKLIAPSFTSQPRDQTVTAGQTATFSASAIGTALVSYQWQFNGVNIADATGTSLVLLDAQAAHAGSYAVVISNGAGLVTSEAATLTVRMPPSISKQPQSQTARSGQSVSFSVVADGDAPLNYQWRWGGVNIDGATNSTLTFASLRSANAGDYSALVSNAVGSITSDPVRLSVLKLDQTILFDSLVTKTFGDASFDLAVSSSSRLPVMLLIISGPAILADRVVMLTGTGTIIVRASQAGTADYNAAPEVERSFTVLRASQTITFSSVDNKAFNAPPFAVVATASSGLPVSLIVVSGPAVLEGGQISITDVGTVVLQASQQGDANFLPAPVVERAFLVEKANQSINFSRIADQNLANLSFSVTASASSGLPVKLSVVAGPATIDENRITVTNEGTVIIRATQPGSDQFHSASEVDQLFVVVKATQAIGFNPIPDRMFGDPPFALTASASSRLPVSFNLVSGSATISLGVVSITGAGPIVIRASQTGDAIYEIARDVEQSFSVAKADQVITFDPLPDRMFGDAPFALVAIASSGLPVSFDIASGPANLAASTVTSTGNGMVVVRAAQSGDANYNAATDVQQSFSVVVGGITEVRLTPQGEFTFSFKGRAGRIYNLEQSGDLRVWTILETRLNSSGTIEFMDSRTSNTQIQTRFYRVVPVL